MRKNFQLVLILASASLLILTFPNFNLEYLAWFGLVPLFFAIENQRPLKAFLTAYIAGAIFFFGTIYWLIHVTLPGMIIVVLYLALYFGFFGLFSSYAMRNIRSSILFFIPATWVALEWLRSTGPAGFGWALLAHSQSFNLPIIQIADITGAYGVSFLIVMANVIIFLIVKNFKNINRVVITAALCSLPILLALIYGYFRLNNIFTGEKVKVAIIQGNIPQAEKWDYNFRDYILNQYEALTQKAMEEKPDLVIWPETSVPGYLGQERDLSERMKALAKDINTPLLVGAPREDDVIRDRYYNSAILLLEDGRIEAHYDKLHLVPFGEYIPFKDIFSFVARVAKNPIGDFSSGKDHTVFRFFIERSSKDKDAVWRVVKKVKFSCLICFEDIFPGLSKEFVKNGADFLINITNDAWFGKSSAAYQHAQCSIFRAVENRVNVVRAANTGLSCFIDQKGRIVDTVEADGEDLFIDGFKSGEITLTKTGTLYTRYGDIFAYICILSVLIYHLSLSRAGKWSD